VIDFLFLFINIIKTIRIPKDKKEKKNRRYFDLAEKSQTQFNTTSKTMRKTGKRYQSKQQ
jgi:hypothetical protein